ncbi:MAG: hypothetical protein RLZZ338_2463 [Cyanobacteriota bacterium]|jgi:hypothetical protein
MPILLSGYGENKGKNLVVFSLVIAAGILLTTFGVSVIMGVNGLLWFQGGLRWMSRSERRRGKARSKFDQV